MLHSGKNRIKYIRVGFFALVPILVFFILAFAGERLLNNFENPLVDKKTNGSGLLVPGRFPQSDEPIRPSKPALIYIDPNNNFAFKNIDLERFGFDFTGIHEARPITVNGEYKIALGTKSDQGDDAEQTKFVILNNGAFGFDNLEIELEEQISDARVRAVFVGDIDNDGEEEIVIGTRPHGILRYYKFIGNQWESFDIGFLNETIHDILVADINGNGRNEILATVSPVVTDTGDRPPSTGVTGRIISYEFNPDTRIWQKAVVWAYGETFPDSPRVRGGVFAHARYLFASDIDGDGATDIITNVVGTKNIDLFTWNGSAYSREIIENALDIHDSAFTVGDIDSDGQDEILALTFPDHVLLMYDYENGSWEREVLAENLVATEPQTERQLYMYIIEAPRNAYGKILYAVPGGPDEDPDERFYYLERDNDTWRKKYIGATDRPIQVWGIFPAAPN